ncbi:MAG: hypothetical protein GX638_09230 [Crenarchaeota archaeon]|nr:hypothetical protein [Thermoproteota archaeon]
MGYQAVVDFSVAFTNHEEISSIIERLLMIPNVTYIVKVEGDFDLHVAALIRDTVEVFKINNEIMQIPNIKKLEAALREAPKTWPSAGQQTSTFGEGIALA